jgi:hypothetical protein
MRHIVFEDWQTICHTIYEGGPLPKESLIYCSNDHIAQLFRALIKEDADREVVVVSAGSDFCVSYNYEGVLIDKMNRWLPMVDISCIQDQPLIQPQRMQIGNVLFDDEFITNCYSWVHSSFSHIPSQVRTWYGVNLDIDNVRCQPIPFGIQPGTASIIDKFKSELSDKDQTMFACFTNTTNERGRIKSALTALPWVDAADKIEHTEFLSRLSKSLFTFCPKGNGYDSYRILESLYVGSIPVIEAGSWTKAYDGLPIIILPERENGGTDWRYLDIDFLLAMFSSFVWPCDKEYIDFNFWSDEITGNVSEI